MQQRVEDVVTQALLHVSVRDALRSAFGGAETGDYGVDMVLHAYVRGGTVALADLVILAGLPRAAASGCVQAMISRGHFEMLEGPISLTSAARATLLGIFQRSAAEFRDPLREGERNDMLECR